MISNAARAKLQIVLHIEYFLKDWSYVYTKVLEIMHERPNKIIKTLFYDQTRPHVDDISYFLVTYSTTMPFSMSTSG